MRYGKAFSKSCTPYKGPRFVRRSPLVVFLRSRNIIKKYIRPFFTYTCGVAFSIDHIKEYFDLCVT